MIISHVDSSAIVSSKVFMSSLCEAHKLHALAGEPRLPVAAGAQRQGMPSVHLAIHGGKERQYTPLPPKHWPQEEKAKRDPYSIYMLIYIQSRNNLISYMHILYKPKSTIWAGVARRGLKPPRNDAT